MDSHNAANDAAPCVVQIIPVNGSQLQDNNASDTEIFIKRPRTSPGDEAFRRESLWSCSQPTLTLNVMPTASHEGSTTSLLPPSQNQLYGKFITNEGMLLNKVIAGHPDLTKAERKIIQTNKFKVWRGLQYFCQSTSFHGLPHMAASRSFTRIAYWMTLLIIAVGLLIWAITSISIAYFNYKTFIIREQKFTDKLKFPAITVCNLNRFAKSKFQESLNYDEDQVFQATLFADVLSTRSMLNVDINLTEEATALTNDVAAFAAGGFAQFSHDTDRKHAVVMLFQQYTLLSE